MTTPKISTETREQLIKELSIILAKAAKNAPSPYGGVYGIILYSPVIIAEMLVDGKPKSEIMDFLTKQNDHQTTTNVENDINAIKHRYLTDVPYDSDLLK